LAEVRPPVTRLRRAVVAVVRVLGVVGVALAVERVLVERAVLGLVALAPVAFVALVFEDVALALVALVFEDVASALVDLVVEVVVTAFVAFAFVVVAPDRLLVVLPAVTLWGCELATGAAAEVGVG
jgi:hypothetical protein